jgi:hypothetical protein
MVDENDRLIYEEIRTETVNSLSNTVVSPLGLVSSSQLSQAIKDFFLPTDFPGTHLTS